MKGLYILETILKKSGNAVAIMLYIVKDSAHQ